MDAVIYLDRPRHFVTRRVGKGVRYYWQPSRSAALAGFKPRPLGDDLAQAVAKAERFNAEWDRYRVGLEGPRVEYGTLEWLVRTYKASGKWPANANSVRQYEWACGLLVDLVKAKGREHAPITGISPKTVESFRAELAAQSPYKARQGLAMLRILLRFAHARGFIQTNPMGDARIARPPSRQMFWEPAEIDAICAAAPGSVATAIRIGAETGQRPGDILSLTWSNVRPSGLLFRQEKTKALVEVPMTRALKAVLDNAPRHGLFVCPSDDGGKLEYRVFSGAFAKARKDSGVRAGLQFRDLRRTCVVRLAEAGCEIPEICAITGHTLASANTILETYLPRTSKMAARGIAKLEAGRNES
jgi:integrase